MICKKCGYKYNQEFNFCGKCGLKVRKIIKRELLLNALMIFSFCSLIISFFIPIYITIYSETTFFELYRFNFNTFRYIDKSFWGTKIFVFLNCFVFLYTLIITIFMLIMTLISVMKSSDGKKTTKYFAVTIVSHMLLLCFLQSHTVNTSIFTVTHFMKINPILIINLTFAFIVLLLKVFNEICEKKELLKLEIVRTYYIFNILTIISVMLSIFFLVNNAITFRYGSNMFTLKFINICLYLNIYQVSDIGASRLYFLICIYIVFLLAVLVLFGLIIYNSLIRLNQFSSKKNNICLFFMLLLIITNMLVLSNKIMIEADLLEHLADTKKSYTIISIALIIAIAGTVFNIITEKFQKQVKCHDH